MPQLTYEVLRRAVEGAGIAIRSVTRLEPAGGPGDKLFPPTFGETVRVPPPLDGSSDVAGRQTKYAVEWRRVDGRSRLCVLLDSVASQATRMEEALLDGWNAGELAFPMVRVDFTDQGHEDPALDLSTLFGDGYLTVLQAPHRLADALLRDSLLEGVPFRYSSVGRRFTEASPVNAAALYDQCPTALVMGLWDSTGPKGGLGSKFQRALVSEIVGIGAELGAKTASRIDPVGIEKTSEDRWHPVVHSGATDLDEIVRYAAEDAADWAGSPILRFRYPKKEKQGVKLVGALQPPVAVFRRWLQRLIDDGDLDALEYAAALASETASEVKKEPVTEVMLREHGTPYDDAAPIARGTMPTAFDFTSRNAQFLEQVDAIRASLDVGCIRQVLRDGAAEGGAGRTMDWDPTADAPGAIYGAHSAAPRAAAEWLAFRGLAFFPVAGRGETLSTTACRGRRKAGVFVWPVWHAPADIATVASLLRCPDLDQLDAASRRERGVAQVFRAQLTKKADGYSGMFAPSQAV